jgi:hypothetical protein
MKKTLSEVQSAIQIEALRDHFAGVAMTRAPVNTGNFSQISHMCYDWADWMIKVREIRLNARINPPPAPPPEPAPKTYNGEIF